MASEILQHIVVTAAYSNALFQATFPLHADFHQRLNGSPLAPSMIQRVIIPDIYPNSDVSLVLTNGSKQWMARGVVDSYQHPRDYFVREWREPYEHFYGPSLISNNEGFQLATNTVLRLGYTMEQFATNWPVKVEGPFVREGNNVPFMSFIWQSPDDEWKSSEIRVDLEHKRVVNFFFLGHPRGKEPKISIIPETVKAYRERMKQTNGLLNISTNK